MYEIILQDDITYLMKSTTIKTVREDSADFDSHSSRSTGSSATREWETKERKNRITEKIHTEINKLMESENEEHIEACCEDLVLLQE